jgi:hypothetical protein
MKTSNPTLWPHLNLKGRQNNCKLTHITQRYKYDKGLTLTLLPNYSKLGLVDLGNNYILVCISIVGKKDDKLFATNTST